MKHNHCRCIFSAIIFAALSSTAGAQNTEQACTVGFVNSVGYANASTGKAPYTASTKTTFEQRLPDGNSIHAYIHAQMARDANGRVMSEMPLGCQLDENGVPQAYLMVSVNDPNAKTRTSWQVGGSSDKIARVSRRVEKISTADVMAAGHKRASSLQRQSGESHSEDLGTRTIAGVEAHGTRTTRTIPAGAEGNELPLIVTHETWTAKDLGIVVLGINDDPRRGQTTFEVEDLTTSEPDPSLFAPPTGYQIQEQAPLIASTLKGTASATQ